MSARQDDPKRKDKPRVPSTGRGAESALDAMVKRRTPVPSQQVHQPQPPPKKKH